MNSTANFEPARLPAQHTSISITSAGRAAAGARSVLFPVQPAYELPVQPEAQRWLVTGLWMEEGVGICGGYEKASVMRRVVVKNAK
jgi:hypothetical protein